MNIHSERMNTPSACSPEVSSCILASTDLGQSAVYMQHVKRWVWERRISGNCGNSVCKYVSLTVKFLPAGELVVECVLVSRHWETVYGESTPGNYKQMTFLTFGASLVF